MELSQEFLIKVESVRNDRAAIKAMLDDILATKRSIKSLKRKWSNSPKDETELRGRERFIQLRRITDKESFLQCEEEYLKRQLARIKRDVKGINRAANKPLGYCHAFVAAAEDFLSQDTYTTIELRALEILNASKENRK